MPTNKVKASGVQDCRYSVDYFLKLFSESNLKLLYEQTNIQRIQVHTVCRHLLLSEQILVP
jgi:hypothetical protein